MTCLRMSEVVEHTLSEDGKFETWLTIDGLMFTQYHGLDRAPQEMLDDYPDNYGHGCRAWDDHEY